MQLDFEDEARNLQAFRANFCSSFWQSLVSYPRPIEGLVSHDVLVETFESGESVANFLERKGSLAEGEWKLGPDGRWKMADGAKKDDDAVLRQNIALCGVQVATRPRARARALALA